MATRTVYVEKDDCTSCSQCTDNLPKYFRFDDDGLAESHVDGGSVQEAGVPDEDQALVQAEIDACPGECIIWKS